MSMLKIVCIIELYSSIDIFSVINWRVFITVSNYNVHQSALEKLKLRILVKLQSSCNHGSHIRVEQLHG